MSRLVLLLIPLATAILLVACGNGQTTPALNVIEVTERTSTMTGFYLDPFDPATRNSISVMRPDDALALVQKEFRGQPEPALDHTNELRFFLGQLWMPPSESPAAQELDALVPIGHAIYVITSDATMTCPLHSGGPTLQAGVPIPTPSPPGQCRWEIQVDATAGELRSIGTAEKCPDFPAPRTCR